MKRKLYNIELSEEAENDLSKSFEYYFKDSPKVADTFFNEINISIEKIKQNPFSFSKVYNNIRKYVIKKFPFVIYYKVENYTIRVIAIFHTSRNPEIWNERIN